MNKLDFLRKLDRYLAVLDQKERQELLAFYEERFYTGTIYENKTEQQVVAELETPEVIAKNILDEYGVSPKHIKTKEERHTGIDTGRLIGLIIVDVMVLSWVIPTLFSVVTSLFASLLSYIGVVPFILGDRTVFDEMIFFFLTGGYILLFSFSLVVLELTIWVIKKSVLYHMNVFKYKKRSEWSKKLSKVSVEGWFKRHKLLRFIKSIASIGAIVVMAYTGFYLYSHYDTINELYINQQVMTDESSLEVQDDIDDLEEWTIITDLDSIDVTIQPVVGNEIQLTHTYKELFDFEWTIDDETNTITINQDVPNQIFQFDFNLESLFSFITNETLVIEIPSGLLVDVVNVKTTNGSVTLSSVDVQSVTIQGTNGKLTVQDLLVEGNVDLDTSNGEIYVKNVTSTGSLTVDTSNGLVNIKDSNFLLYDLDTSNGAIKLRNLNTEFQNGLELEADTSNGQIIMTNVYVAVVDLKTTNGNITINNEDTSFDIDLTKRTTNGQITSNIN